jgi:hypothetical protein
MCSNRDGDGTATMRAYLDDYSTVLGSWRNGRRARGRSLDGETEHVPRFVPGDPVVAQLRFVTVFALGSEST